MQTIEKTKTLQPVKTDLLVFSPMVKKQVIAKLDVLRIELDENYTRIDFICYAKQSELFIFAWISISTKTFIKAAGSEQELTLVKADNIPVTPQRHYFKTNNDFLCYTLYFPPLPKDVKTIDIIEKGAAGNVAFNFYGVSLQKIKQEALQVNIN